MAELAQSFVDRVKAIGGSWTAYTAVGSFVLYVLGYLALRFHLTALGIGADLAVLDERYLFTGARFLVYLAASATSAVLFGLLLLMMLYMPYRLVPAAKRKRLSGAPSTLAASHPGWLLLAGIVFSVAMIQFVMRDCFELSNLLLREKLPESRFSDWLLREDEGRIALFFAGLVAACAVPAALLLALRSQVLSPGIAVLRNLLFALFAIQLLLLPINYGYLVLDTTLPRVASLDGVKPLPQSSTAWLVWEGKDGVTFLVRAREGDKIMKSLLTLPRSEAKRVEIRAYDRIYAALFAPQLEKPQ
jgi:hypothetical protein